MGDHVSTITASQVLESQSMLNFPHSYQSPPGGSMEETAVAVGEGNVLSNTTEYLHQVLVVDQQALPVCVCVCVCA